VKGGEGRLARLGWRALAAAGRVVGPRVARGAAAVVLRARAGSADGWLAGVHRLAGRPAPGAPAPTRLPEGWWTASPLVRVRRLGLRVELDLRDNLQRVLYATGTYEPALLRFLEAELRPGDVMVDVGAHVGVHALHAAARLRRLGGGTVVAFEPARDSAAKLRAAAARNRVELTVVEAALGAAPGTAELRADPAYDPADAGVRSLHGRGGRVQAVTVTTFDAWAAEARLERLDLVKLDVEGSELEALRGMAGSLGRLRPRALVVEVKQRVLDRAGVDGDEIHLLLARLGYAATGQVLPVANQVYRPAPGPSGNRVPGAVHRRSGAGGGCGAARIVGL
jgi:FkbM family methyltransferase